MAFEQYISHPADSEEGDPTLLIGEAGYIDKDGHLRLVADRMVDACCGQKLSDGTPAEHIAEVIGLTHDFTKLTSWAQKHLRNQPFQEPKTYRYHSFSSSLVTLYCLSEGRGNASDYAAKLATLVVAGHHNIAAPPENSHLANYYGKDNKEIQERYKRVQKQFEDIDSTVPERADRIIQTATNGSGSWNDFYEWHKRQTSPIDDVHSHLKFFAEMGNQNPTEGHYADVLNLWTALKFADQTAASGIDDEELGGVLPDRSDLDEHIQDLESGEGVLKNLNDLRNQARKQATENVASLVSSDDVGLISLPTGFGKTYAGLSAGLRAAEIRESRLVYVLPYTSILDQTAAEIQSIFDVSPYSEAFTLHHHLADTYTRLGKNHTDSDIGRSPAALHAESWRSGLTLTTTVQLFESLTAPTARQATRLPSLRNSVVIIDEPQAIPERWWQIVPKLIELLVTAYDATVILMTATQPGLVKYGSDKLSTRELTENTEQYTDFLADHPRVVYRLHDTVNTDLGDDTATLDYSTAGSEVSAEADRGKDVLAVCNTRASAKNLYQNVILARAGESESVELGRLIHELVSETGTLPSVVELRKRALDALEGDSTTLYAFLSGDVRPDDRSLIIEALYDDSVDEEEEIPPLLDCDVSIVLISTSVVEAGVDISFDTVFRDYAPIPNIIQSGGRCNRSFGNSTGEVVIWRLGVPEDGYDIPSLQIHGGDGGEALPLLMETGQVLQRHATDEGTIDEATMVSKTVSDFYNSLFTGLEPGEEALADAVEGASMSELEGEHMITEIDGYEDVMACLTDMEREDLLSSEIDIQTISRYPGSQVNTDPGSRGQECVVGNSTYVVLDARGSSYHPVFGVQ